MLIPAFCFTVFKNVSIGTSFKSSVTFFSSGGSAHALRTILNAKRHSIKTLLFFIIFKSKLNITHSHISIYFFRLFYSRYRRLVLMHSRKYWSCHIAASHHYKSGRAETPSHNRHEHHTSARRFSWYRPAVCCWKHIHLVPSRYIH